jgi:hypothetical protein
VRVLERVQERVLVQETETARELALVKVQAQEMEQAPAPED